MIRSVPPPPRKRVTRAGSGASLDSAREAVERAIARFRQTIQRGVRPRCRDAASGARRVMENEPVSVAAERIPYITVAIAFLGLIGGLILRVLLAIGDSLFRLFWRRNDDFVRQRTAAQFAEQMMELAKLPAAIEHLSVSMRSQTAAISAVSRVQGEQGEAIAAVSTAIQFLVPDGHRFDLEHPLRRQRSRRATDPAPSDRPLQAEDVGGTDPDAP